MKISSVDTSKLLDSTSEVIEKIIKESRERQLKEDKIKNTIEDHHSNMIGHVESENGLTEKEFEFEINKHFDKVDELTKNTDFKNLDIETLKNDLESLDKQFQINIEEKYNSKSSEQVNIHISDKEFANKQINDRIDKFEKEIKDMSERESYNENDLDNSNQATYENKIEKSLRNNPRLLEKALLSSQIHSMNKHISDSLNQQDDLDDLIKANPKESDKIQELKHKLDKHIVDMKGKVKDLNKTLSNDKDKDKQSNKDNSKSQKLTVKTEKEITHSR